MSIRDFISECIERLSPLYPQPEAKSIAFRLLEHYTDIPSYKFVSDPGMDVAEDVPLRSALAELETGRPLQYVLGVTEFCGHRFKVGEGCLIPRPETEELVSRIIDDLSGQEIGEEPFNILDLCTGSGCIAWSLAAAFPEAMVYGCDLSDAALRYACKQRVKVRGAKPIFFSADVLATPPAGLPKFDVIVSNPPYICESERVLMRTNVKDFEPAEALFVPDDDPLRFYAAIARWADVLLRPDGRLYLEINERFGTAVAALFPGSHIAPDISGRDRFVIR
jgi:release factor glutamine methyltransferase